jgi:hypothetical protein
VLETRHGVLVETLIDAGFTLLPVNPDLVARRRGPAKKNDDAEDARICCVIALDQFLDLRKLIPHGELAGELRAIARDDKRAARDQRRLLNRLRTDLLATSPAVLAIAGDDLGSPIILKLLAAWPTHVALAELDHQTLEGFARSPQSRASPGGIGDRNFQWRPQPARQMPAGRCRQLRWQSRGPCVPDRRDPAGAPVREPASPLVRWMRRRKGSLCATICM